MQLIAFRMDLGRLEAGRMQKDLKHDLLNGCPEGNIRICLCCVVMPAGTVSLFCRSHFIDVYCHMFIAALQFLSHRS